MPHTHVFILLIAVLFTGCERSLDSVQQLSNTTQSLSSSSQKDDDTTKPLGKTINNRFGMTFHLIDVNPDRDDHDDSFPARSYYLQETTLTYDQYEAIIQFTKENSFGQATFPSEWRNCFNLAQILSKHDPDYDYRLPTREEWSFACLNGYDQACPQCRASWSQRKSPDAESGVMANKFQLRGLYEQNAECIDSPGNFMGINDEGNPGCRRVIVGDPDADDGLNEIIVARFVLVPK